MAIIKKYKAEVISVSNPVDNIFTVEFKSLSGIFKFNSGQFLHLALDEYDPAGQWPDSRCFSMQSTPNENLIKITYAVKGRFTSRMKQELKAGIYVTLKLPYGELFTHQHNKVNTVFIAGGTGITPFLSLFTDSTFSVYEKPILYAGFRNAKMNFYQNQIESAKKINPGLEVHLAFQDSDGILEIDKIYRESCKRTSFFISGPPDMIKSFREYLLKEGLNTDQIRTDDWE
jgi:predicted ferric reductase